MSDFSFHLFLPEEEAVDGPAKIHERYSRLDSKFPLICDKHTRATKH